MISKWWDSHQASPPYHWNWFSAFCWFLQSKTFHGCQGESFLLKVNGFNWIFQKQKTDNGRNFVPISLLNMKVFWGTPSSWYWSQQRSNSQTWPGCFAVFDGQWNVCWSGDLEIWTWMVSLQDVRVDSDDVMMRMVFHWVGRVNIYTTSPPHIKPLCLTTS